MSFFKKQKNKNNSKKIKTRKIDNKINFTKENSQNKKNKSMFSPIVFVKIMISYFKSIIAVTKDIFKNFTSDIKNIKKNKNQSACNNFKLGINNLGLRDFKSAKIRFWLCTKFAPQSPLPLFYIGYTNYLTGNYTKAMAIFKECIKMRPRMQDRIFTVIDKIKMTNPELVEGSMFKQKTQQVKNERQARSQKNNPTIRATK